MAKRIDYVRSKRRSHVIVVLVGDKTDQANKREMSCEEVHGKANKLNVMFIETSAEARYSVKQLLQPIAGPLPGIAKKGKRICNFSFLIYCTSFFNTCCKREQYSGARWLWWVRENHLLETTKRNSL